VQCAEDPQSPTSEHEQPAWFAKQRPPVQWRSAPQSFASLHARAPVVGHSEPDGSAVGTTGSLQATMRETTASATRSRETFTRRSYPVDWVLGGSAWRPRASPSRYPACVPKRTLTSDELEALSSRTLSYYDNSAQSFAAGTRDHDVSQNYAALLGAIEGPPPFRILDFGCGPGRDLAYFRKLGHEAVGLDGSAQFVAMAREATGCEVLHQSFLDLSLEPARYDGIFANASLFHVPTQELPRVLGQLRDALAPRGVLFCSNPRGADSEGFNGERYGAFHSLETWREQVTGVGFTEIDHYYRPAGLPREQQPWLATVWRK
jgi:SAM-dependent methyltransferase